MTPSIASLVTALLSLVLNIVTAEVTEAEQVQDSLEAYMNLDQVETVEGFMKTREFKVSLTQNTGRPGQRREIVFNEMLPFSAVPRIIKRREKQQLTL